MRKLGLLVFLLIFFGCNQSSQTVKNQQIMTDSIPALINTYEPKPYVQIKHPEWSKNATIYEVNVRQFTPEGTFKAFETHLPRLKELGVDIIWLMPIHPIGEKNRKGTLGSYYSVKDYYDVNPEFGTLDDFKHLVAKIHDMGMYVIIDWVANHSAWDNALATEHPDWYSKTPEGEFQPTPWYDWEDIIDFDYDQPGIRKYMTEVLIYWVTETDIDGYRCDVAGFIPVDFWDNVRTELDNIKPVFMLAEWESRDLHRNAFDMTYSWSLWDKMHGITSEGKPISGLVEYFAHDVSTFPHDAYRMTFVENHDKNSWEGNQIDNFGDGLYASIVLSCVVNGMPLIYSGQEAGLNRSLAFFEKDPIEWKQHPIGDLYKKMFALKHQNQALWNGANGGEMVRIFSDNMEQVISFTRQQNNNKVVVVINYTNKPASVNLKTHYHTGSYIDYLSNEAYTITESQYMELKPWEYLVLIQQD